MVDDRLRILGQEIKALRKAAGMSGQSLAEAAGVSQPTVSRVENGQRVADVGSVKRIISALGLDHATAVRLSSEMADAYAAGSERRADAGYSLSAENARRVARAARSVSCFESATVPTLLRTSEFARAVGAEPVERMPSEARFVLTEAALRTWPGDGGAVDDQLAHLEAMTERADVHLGILPWPVAVPEVPPHGFALFDDSVVLVSTFTTEITVTEPQAVDAYRTAFALVEGRAAYGVDARRLIAQVRSDLTHFPGFIQ